MSAERMMHALDHRPGRSRNEADRAHARAVRRRHVHRDEAAHRVTDHVGPGVAELVECGDDRVAHRLDGRCCVGAGRAVTPSGQVEKHGVWDRDAARSRCGEHGGPGCPRAGGAVEENGGARRFAVSGVAHDCRADVGVEAGLDESPVASIRCHRVRRVLTHARRPRCSGNGRTAASRVRRRRARSRRDARMR